MCVFFLIAVSTAMSMFNDWCIPLVDLWLEAIDCATQIFVEPMKEERKDYPMNIMSLTQHSQMKHTAIYRGAKYSESNGSSHWFISIFYNSLNQILTEI